MVVGRWTHGLAGAVLAMGALVLLYYSEFATMDRWYSALLVVGTAGVSFAVGWVMGYLTESGLTPGSEGRE